MRARDAVESNPCDRDSYTKLDPEKMQEAGAEYAAILLTIQIQLDRISIENKHPGPTDIMALRHIAELATQASKTK